jgi:hypothetical protein
MGGLVLVKPGNDAEIEGGRLPLVFDRSRLD